MTVSNRTAARAALAIALLSAAAIAAGVALMASLGGTSGKDLGAGADAASFARVAPLLLVAEVLKILTGAAQALVAVHLAARARQAGSLLRLLGYAGAALIAASGIVGLYAIAVETAALRGLISGIGFAGVASTGAWILLLLLVKPVALPRWASIAGALCGLLAIASLGFPPLAMLSALFGWLWWPGLGSAIRRAA